MKQSFVDSPVYVSKSDTIITSVCQAFGVTRDDFISHRRSQAMFGARFAAAMLLREKTPLSLPAIGRICGGRDHTTIMHSLKRAEAMMADDGFKERVERARATLGEV